MQHHKVLIIEDDPLILENVLELLEMKGYKPYGAKNALSGLKLLEEIKPDIILCDYKLPDKDGFEIIKIIREDLNIDIPFIFITAKAERETQRMGMNLGADDYITKPFTAKEIIDSIESRLRKSKLNLKNKQKLPKEYYTLSKTEKQILLKISQGKTSLQIANELYISPKTVTNHRYNISQKLNLKGTHSLTRFIINLGLEN